MSPKVSVLVQSRIVGDNANIMSIFVGNLSYQVSEDDIKQVFAEYGSVKRVNVPVDRESGRVRGFAFVEMSSDAEENGAIEALDGAEWMGRTMRVDKARPRDDKGGGGGGGRQGRKHNSHSSSY